MQSKETKIQVKLKPGAKNDNLSFLDDGSIAASVTSRPINGKANEHLIKLLAKALHISKSSCTLIQGKTSRIKVIALSGLEMSDIIERIKTYTCG